MAQLKNGTSIGGNLALHTGNISSLFQAIQDYSGDVTFKQNVTVNGELNAKTKLNVDGVIDSKDKITASSKGRTIGASNIGNGAIVINGKLGIDDNEIQSDVDLHIGTNANKLALRMGTTEKLTITSGSVAFSVPISEQGTTLSAKYLGKTAKAVDSDKLDGLNSSQFLRKDVSQTLDAGTNTTFNVKSGDGGISLIRAYGDTQGTGIFYAGQSTSHGGGFGYNGDGTPTWIGGSDRINFYRRTSNNEHVVFSYAHDSSTVNFETTPTISSSNHLIYHEGHKPTSAEVGALPLAGKAADSNLLDGLNSTDFLKQHNDWKEYVKIYTVSKTLTLPVTDFTGANIGTVADKTFLLQSFPNSTGTVTGETVIVKVDGNKGISIKKIYDSSAANNAIFYVEGGILRVKSAHDNNYSYTTKTTELRNNSNVFDYLDTYRKDQSDARFLGKTAKAANSTLLNGFVQNETNVINTIVKRNGSGDIIGRLFRSEYQNQNTISGAIAYRINTGTDNYIRYCSDMGSVRDFVGVFSKTESDARFLGKTAKAADTDKLDGLNSTNFARLGLTSQPDNYLYLYRNSAASTFYSVNGGVGDLARFVQGGSGSTESASKSVVITNDGGINATSTIVAPSISAPNPNNKNATASLNYANNKARIRIGGSGVGTSGFSIQGTGDNNMADFTGSDILVGTSNYKVWHKGNDDSLIYGSNLSGSTKITDLNSIIKSGFYDGESLTNSPISGAGWGWILNIAHTNNSSTVKYGGQLIIENDSNNPEFWFRARASNGNGVWKEVMQKDTAGVTTGRIKVVSTGNDYNSGGIEVLGNGTTNTIFPTIGFHQSGKFASSIQLRNGGDFRLYTQGTAAYASLRLSTAYHSGSSIYESRNNSPMGVYESTKTSQVWSMGASYRNDSSGSDFGNLYGLAYKHTNNTTGGTMAGGHQILMVSNGDPKCSMGENMWTKGSYIQTSGNGVIKFSDVNKYVFSTGGSYDWGLFWDTNVNQFSFRGAGIQRWWVDCDNGDTSQAGVAYFSGGSNTRGIGSYIGNGGGGGWFANKQATVNIDTNSSGSTAHAFLRQLVNGTQKGVFEALNTGTVWRMQVNASGNFDFNSGGSFVASGNVTAYSDIRTKRDIKVIDSALDKIDRLKGVTFNRTDIPELGKQTGLIAQDLIKVLPEAVTVSKTEDLKTFPDGKKLSVSYGNVVGLLVEGIKEEKKKRLELEEEVAKLKAIVADNDAFRSFVLDKLTKLEKGE